MAERAGTNAPDNLVGTAESDTFYQLGSGNDTVNGLGGYDFLDYRFDGGGQGIVVTINASGNGTVVDTFGDTDTIFSVQAFGGTLADDVFIFSDGANFFVSGNGGSDEFKLGAVQFGRISYASILEGDSLDFIRETAPETLGVRVDVETGTVLKFNSEVDAFNAVDQLAFRGTELGDLLISANDGLTTYFEGMGGDDTIVGGDGYDFVTYQQEGADLATGFTIDLQQGTATNARNGDVDTLIGVSSVEGSDFADVFIGDDSWNYFVGRGGDDEFFGAGGRDTVAYWDQASVDFEISGIGTDTVTVEDIAGDWGTDSLSGIERIEFADATVRLDVYGNAGQVYRLYQAAYVREPDTGGLAFYIDAVDAGLSLPALADLFIVADEFIENYGEDVSDAELIDILYNNVLGRNADETGKQFWVEQLGRPEFDAGDLLHFFSESDENIALVAPAIEDGIWL